MPIYKNKTLNNISVVVNGVRKNIRPGESISGPESFKFINGLELISPEYKQLIQQPTIQNFNIISNIVQNKKYNFIYDNTGNSNFSNICSDELEYLKLFKSKNTLPTISIAILTKNQPILITDCCESILKKVEYKNISLVIIDTGTTDKSVLNYYDTLEEKCKLKNWKYKFVQLDKFHYGKNYNSVIKNNIDTDYVLIQNNDTKAINDYVTEMMKVAIFKPVGSVGCRMFYPDGSIQHDGQTFYNGPNKSLGGATHLHLQYKKEALNSTDHGITLVDGNTAAGCLLRTEDFLKIDGFDETYKDIFQDVDLMAKIPHILNKFNYCNRKAEIYHIDNATRKHIGLNQDHINFDVQYIQTKFRENGLFNIKNPKSVDFSIITLVRNINDYSDFLDSIKKQNGKHTIELISIPNFYNTFTSAYEGLNIGIDISNGHIIILCHEDIVVSENWLNKIKENIINISQNNDIGVLGMAGITNSKTPCFYLTNENGIPIVQTSLNNVECQSLDELCLITLKENNLKFDDNILKGFHFYGINLCLNAKFKHLKNYAIDAYCYHKSDGSKNLRTTEQFNKYEQCAIDFNNFAKSKGVFNWRSTTAESINGVLTFFPKRP